MSGMYQTSSAAYAGAHAQEWRKGTGSSPYKRNIAVSLFQHSWVWLVGRLPSNFSLRQRVALILSSSRLGNGWDIVQTIASLVSCVYYVLSTYDTPSPYGLDEGLTVLFTVDYIVRLFASNSRLRYPFGFFPIIDLLTCLPVYFSWILKESYSQLNFVRFVRVLRIMRILRSFKILNAALSPLSKQLITLFLSVVSMVFLYAGLFELVEGQLFEDLAGYEQPRSVTFGSSVYYAVVTLATVGYGDIYPLTAVGKFLCCCFIVTAIVVVPMQVNTLADVMAMQSKYKVKLELEPDSGHVLLIGNVKDDNMVREFLRELYHEDRTENSADVRTSTSVCVIMGPDEPSVGMKKMLVAPSLVGRIAYIRGSPMSQEDLARVQADAADAIFIISDINAADPAAADNATILRALRLKNVAPHVPIYLHTVKVDAVKNVHSGHEIKEAVCVDEWRMRMLAHSSIIPGFSTLVTNLIRSMSSLPPDIVEPWQVEYSGGASAEVYPVPSPPAFDGMAFSDVARALHDTFKGRLTVWGVRDPDVSGSSPLGSRRLRQMSQQAVLGNLMSTAPLRIVGNQEDMQEDREGTLDAIAAVTEATGPQGLKLRHGRRTSALAALVPGVTIPGQVLFNPGKDYRVKAGQTIYIVAETAGEADVILEANAFAGYAMAAPLAPHADGGTVEGGYGYPRRELKGSKGSFSWEHNARTADHKDRFLNIFGGYAPSHLEEQREMERQQQQDADEAGVEAGAEERGTPAEAMVSLVDATTGQPARALSGAAAGAAQALSSTAGVADGAGIADTGSGGAGLAPLRLRRMDSSSTNTSGGTGGSNGDGLFKDSSASPAPTLQITASGGTGGGAGDAKNSSKAKAVKVWSKLRQQVQQAAARSRTGSVAAAPEQDPLLVGPSWKKDKLRNRSRRLSHGNVAVTPGVELLAATTARMAAGKRGGLKSAADAALDRQRALRSVMLRDVATVWPPLHRHIIVCGSLRAFKGYMAPIRDPHTRHTALWRHVVLMTAYDDTPSTTATIEELSKHKGVHIILGSPSNRDDLVRAGVMTADCVVLLSDTGVSAAHDAREASSKSNTETADGGDAADVSSVKTPSSGRRRKQAAAAGGGSGGAEEAEALDSTVIFRYLVLEQHLSTLPVQPNFYVVVELTLMGNLQVLNSKRLGKIRMQEVLANHRTELAAMLSGEVLTAPAYPGSKSARVLTAQPVVTLTVKDEGSRGQSSPNGKGLHRTASSNAMSAPTNRDANQRLRQLMRDKSLMPAPVIGAASRARQARNEALAAATAAGLPGAGLRQQHRPGAQQEAKTGWARAVSAFGDFLGSFVGWKSLSLLQQSYGAEVNGMFALPFFAAGYAFPVDTLHAVLASAYYNTDIVPFAEELLAPCPGRASRLLAEPVPRRFHGKTYAFLWREMSSKYDAVVVGLYRCRGAAGSSLSYVMTNPSPATVLVSTDDEEDLMYVLSRAPLFVGPQAIAPHELAGMEADWHWPGTEDVDRAIGTVNHDLAGASVAGGSGDESVGSADSHPGTGTVTFSTSPTKGTAAAAAAAAAGAGLGSSSPAAATSPTAAAAADSPATAPSTARTGRRRSIFNGPGTDAAHALHAASLASMGEGGLSSRGSSPQLLQHLPDGRRLDSTTVSARSSNRSLPLVASPSPTRHVTAGGERPPSALRRMGSGSVPTGEGGAASIEPSAATTAPGGATTERGVPSSSTPVAVDVPGSASVAPATAAPQ